jgi:hypothetical protein
MALTIREVEMREKPPSPCALQGTDRVVSLLLYCKPLCSLAKLRGMHGPSSSHLGSLRFICGFGGNCMVGARERTHRV